MAQEISTLSGLAKVLATAFNHADQQLVLEFSSPREAYNFRQRLYRLRDTIRKTAQHPLFVQAPNFVFLLNDEKLTVQYIDKSAEIKELLCQQE